MTSVFADADVARALLAAEQQVRLIDRVAPENLVEERERLLGCLLRKERAEPRLRYARAPDLAHLRSRLRLLAASIERSGGVFRLYAARALELEQEAAMVEAIDRPSFRALARDRFEPDEESSNEEVRALVDAWLQAPPPESEGELTQSDDELSPHSLVSILRVRIGASKKAIRVALRPGLATVAAAGEDIVLVRPGVPLSRKRALRIALHELEAHVFPRLAAHGQTVGLFRAGARRSAEHEEGRALLIEERATLLDAERRRELALRHLAASAVREGATLMEGIAVVSARGAGVEQALEVTLRALRGGGLAREVVYLPAYLHVRRVLSERPRLERWFVRGRVSLEAAREFERLEPSLDDALEPRARSA